MMFFKLQSFPQSRDAEIGDLPGKGACDLPQSMAVGIRFDDCQDICLGGLFSQGLKISKQAIRTDLDPCAVLDPGFFFEGAYPCLFSSASLSSGSEKRR